MNGYDLGVKLEIHPKSGKRPMAQRFNFASYVAVSGILFFGRLDSAAAEIKIPNGSFESPQVLFVDTTLDSWQKSPKPDWYIEDAGFFWSQLVGVFKNPAKVKSDHLDNCDGEQAVWLFAVPGVGIQQDAFTKDWDDPTPSGAFQHQILPNNFYSLTVGINGGGGGMKTGVALKLELYAINHSSTQTIIASTNLSHSLELFPNRTHLTEFTLRSAVFNENHPLTGQQLGIKITSLANQDNQGGYWVLDNLRLTHNSPPRITKIQALHQHLELTITSEPKSVLEIQGTDSFESFSMPEHAWRTLNAWTNETGMDRFVDERPQSTKRFYRIALPASTLKLP